MKTPKQSNADVSAEAEKDGKKARPLASEQIEARNELVKENIGLVYSIVKRKFNFLEGLQDDLVQEGMLGLMDAAQRFDINRGFRFSTYATRYIEGYILRALKNIYFSSAARIPVHQYDKLQKLKNSRKKLASKLNRQPTSEELSEFMSLPKRKIQELSKDEKMLYPSSLDSPVKNDDEDGGSWYELTPGGEPTPEDNLITEDCRQKIKEHIRTALRQLDIRTQKILAMRFGLSEFIEEEGLLDLIDDDNEDEQDNSGKFTRDQIEKGLTLKAVGDIFNKSRERIRQVTEEAKLILSGDEKLQVVA